MNANPVLVFDLGKVLVDFDYRIASEKIARHSRLGPRELHAFLGSSPLLADYESGRLSREEFFKSLKEAVGFQKGLLEFSGFFADIFTEIPLMTGLQRELRKRGFQTYIFSNTNDLAVEHIRKNFPFFADFNGYVYSFQVGAMKPQPAIYEAMESLACAKGRDLIYIDDRPENIEAGLARGWQAILHEDPVKTRREVISLL